MKTCGFLLASFVMACSALHPTSLGADDARTASDFKIRMSLDRSTNKMKLSCSEGCAWVTTDFDCDPDAACSAVVDGYGIMTPVTTSE